jgi:hypothetical protein
MKGMGDGEVRLTTARMARSSLMITITSWKMMCGPPQWVGGAGYSSAILKPVGAARSSTLSFKVAAAAALTHRNI